MHRVFLLKAVGLMWIATGLPASFVGLRQLPRAKFQADVAAHYFSQPKSLLVGDTEKITRAHARRYWVTQRDQPAYLEGRAVLARADKKPAKKAVAYMAKYDTAKYKLNAITQE